MPAITPATTMKEPKVHYSQYIKTVNEADEAENYMSNDKGLKAAKKPKQIKAKV